MRPATLINQDEYALMDAIILEKEPPRNHHLNVHRATIDDAYDVYLQHFATLASSARSAITDAMVDCKEALRNCYSSQTASAKNAIRRIFNEQQDELKQLCPYCMIDTPSTIDHYIGQSEYPEYAILVHNLIPCCYKCNNVKRENWRTGQVRQFIHFYNDGAWLNHRFLFAAIDWPLGDAAPLVQFSLQQPDTIDNNSYQTIVQHFNRLRLLTKYQQQARSELSTTIEKCRASVQNGFNVQVLRVMMAAEKQSLAARFGQNYWRPVLLETLAANLDLIMERLQ
jgi:hypothetical protein